MGTEEKVGSDTCYGQLASLVWSDLAQEEPHETNEQPDGRKVRLSLFNCTQFFFCFARVRLTHGWRVIGYVII